MATYDYMMLSRLKSDCDYYLNCGGRSPRSLWAGNVKDQIAEMKLLWDKLPENGKPEWLTFEQICDYETAMTNIKS